MGTTITVIYPLDPEFRPTAEAVDQLKAMGSDLATRVGFPVSPHFSPQARIIEAVDCNFGLGIDRDPVISAFAIVVEDALRYCGNHAHEGRLEPYYDSGVPAETLEELEALLGTKLGQLTYKR